jgi:hypothetical protein
MGFKKRVCCCVYSLRPRKMERGDKEKTSTAVGGVAWRAAALLFVAAAHPRIETSAVRQC